MSAYLKSALTAIGITLLFVALIGCDSQPTPTPDPEPPASATPEVPAPTASPEPPASATPVAPAPTASPEPPASATPEVPAPTASPEPPASATPVAPAPTASPEPPASATPDAPAPTASPEPPATGAPISGPDDSLSFDPSVVRGTLTNGLAYYIQHNEEPRNRAQVALVIKAGSILEEESQRGLAHFVEHMAFNGTARFAKQEIVDYLESIGSTFGADLNAQTSFDDTVYWVLAGDSDRRSRGDRDRVSDSQ